MEVNMRNWLGSLKGAKRLYRVGLPAALVVLLLFAQTFTAPTVSALTNLTGFYDVYRLPGYAAAVLESQSAVTQDETVDIEVFEEKGTLAASVIGTYRLTSDTRQDIQLGLPFLTSDVAPAAQIDGRSAEGEFRYGDFVQDVAKQDVLSAASGAVPDTEAFVYRFTQGPVTLTLAKKQKIFVSAADWRHAGNQIVFEDVFDRAEVLSVGEPLVFEAPVQPTITQTTCARYVEDMMPAQTDAELNYLRHRIRAAFRRFLNGNRTIFDWNDLMAQAEGICLGVLVVPLTLRPGEPRTVTFAYTLRPNPSRDYQTPLYAFYFQPIVDLDTRSASRVSVAMPSSYPYVVESKPALTKQGDRYAAELGLRQSVYWVASSTRSPGLATELPPAPERHGYGFWIGVGAACLAAIGLIAAAACLVVRMRKSGR